ncbi:hypothetical protein B4U80_06160 [Leptotrombidium deliense]|uniref:Uncharacterized protein n=1 Tax=Leptotrombidium deliense TaxID=299467 RepID=A0A443RVG9_9ACAR|nr:hypothetical protein B4U80_06160 [Leptotrombidium deliense]
MKSTIVVVVATKRVKTINILSHVLSHVFQNVSAKKVS